MPAARGDEAAPPGDRARDAQAIRAAAAAYLEALKRGDSTALEAAWTPDGDIVDEAGAVLAGRDAAGQTAPADANVQRPEVRIDETRLRFVTDDVAIEDGTVEVRPQGGPPLAGRFTATWVRHEGRWKLAALREAGGPGGDDAGQLRDLDWMVGEWTVTEGDGSTDAADATAAIDVVVRWNATKTYLIRELRIRPAAAGPDAAGLTIMQVIGWEPLSRRIRGWAFGSDGSHGEAVLSRDGDAWIAETKSVRADGGITSALNIYNYDGKDRCTWRSLPTNVGGAHAPPVTMTMVRRKPGGAKP